MTLLQKALVRALSGLFFLIGAVAAQAATGSGIYVDIRASEAPGAPVAERWKLYGASHALVIGIDNYTGGWPRLSNAIKDATLVAEALRGRGFEVELLTDVTGDELRRALRRFFAYKGADPEARLFVWFAGHGHTENGEGYLVPADAPPPGSPDFAFSALHMGDLGSMVRIAKSKHVLAVFDSCFAGTIFSSQRARPPAAITAAVKRPVRQVLTSGDADQQVSDDGTFRTLFLRALRGEETADANRDGYLTATELSFYLEDRVINLTQGLQTPRGGKLRDPKYDQGDFVFLLPKALPGGASAAAAPPASEKPAVAPSPVTPAFDIRAMELSFWESIKGSDNAKTFEAYLERYPDGLFAGVARVRIEELTQQAAQPAAQARASDSQVAKTAPASATPADAPFGSAEEVLRHLKKNEETIRRKFTNYNRKTDAVESLYGPTIVDIYKFDVREIVGDTVSVFMIFAAGSRRAAGGTRTSQINELVVQLRWRDGAFEFVGHRRP